MKVADFLVSKNSVWSSSKLEDYWSRELIVTHPFRIFLRWFYHFPIAGAFALLGWSGVLGGLYYIGHGLFTLMPPEIIAGVFAICISYVLASICTAYVTKHILETIDLLILATRKKEVKAIVMHTYRTKSDSPTSPVFSWHLEVKYLFEDENGKRSTINHYGKTQLGLFHDWLERGLQKGNELTLIVDPKKGERARVLYIK